MSLPLLQNFINGKFIPAATDATFDVVDPRTEQVVAQCPVSGSADVDAAYDAALKAFESWRLTTPAERQMLLLRLADALEANADRLVEAQRRNTGQLAEMIRAEEVVTGASQLRFFAGAARLQSGVASGEYAEGLNSQIRREPIGVVGQIVPWNYPFMMLIWKVGPALAAGNTVVLKPSANTPESAIVFAEIAGEILPPGVFNLVLGTGETGRLMSAHPVPGLVALTGSVRAGSDLAEQAAGNVTRVHLELGGKAPRRRLRRCRHRGGCRGHRRRRDVQRRAGLHRRHPRAGRGLGGQGVHRCAGASRRVLADRSDSGGGGVLRPPEQRPSLCLRAEDR